MAIDGDWIYVCVGKQPWELCCISISTGEMRMLKRVPATGNMAFTIEPGIGIYVTIDTDLGQPDNHRTQFWCVDGAIKHRYVPNEKPADIKKKFTPRDCTPYSNPSESAGDRRQPGDGSGPLATERLHGTVDERSLSRAAR